MARVLGLVFSVLVALVFLSPPASAASSFSAAYAACVDRGETSLALHPSMYQEYRCAFYNSHELDLYLYTDYLDSWSDSFGWQISPAPSCSSSVGQVVPVVLPNVDSLPGPTYSTDPGGYCECVFSGAVLYQGGGVSGTCQSTGNVSPLFSPPADPLPDPPPVLAPADPPPPCGGGSCYDPATNQFCAVDGSGHQVCVPGPAAQAPDAGKTPQSCATGDGVQVCAGTPSAPEPSVTPLPSMSGTSDVQTSDGQGGPVYTTVVNVYDTTHQGNNANPGDGSTSTGSLGNGGNNGSEGKADSTGKCSDGKTPSAGGCGAGYADRGCDSPPTCSGDPLLCAGVKEQHATRCAQAKARASLADASSANAALDSQGFPSNDADPPQADYLQSVDVDGEGGPSLDASGWGFSRTCPIEAKSFVLMGQSVTIDYGQACGALSLGAILVMIMAYLAAARILFFRG